MPDPAMPEIPWEAVGTKLDELRGWVTASRAFMLLDEIEAALPALYAAHREQVLGETRCSFTADEKALLIARLARGKSVLPWRAAEEEAAIDKLMAFLDTTLGEPKPTIESRDDESRDSADRYPGSVRPPDPGRRGVDRSDLRGPDAAADRVAPEQPGGSERHSASPDRSLSHPLAAPSTGSSEQSGDGEWEGRCGGTRKPTTASGFRDLATTDSCPGCPDCQPAEQPEGQTRCGGTRFKTSKVGDYPFYNTDLECPGCPDCQPATEPSKEEQ